MRMILLFLGVVLAGACSRKVVVTTPTAPATAAPTLKVTNTASQTVTVYYTGPGGNEVPVGQVAANTTQVLTISGVAVGTTVKLRAALADGSRSYSREGVQLTSVFEWRVP